MAIKIPNKAFLSFSFKQCVDTFWRAGMQVEQHWQKASERDSALGILKKNLETLLSHEEEQVKTLAQELLEHYPSDEASMQNWLMKLERLAKKDLKDSDFLISTVDQFDKEKSISHPIHIVLDNLRSSFNVGSLFRTAEALGILKIHLCGYTPTPENSKTAKSALGTDDWIEWKYWESTLECLEHLKSEGVTLYAFETEQNATCLSEVVPASSCGLILGNERYGLSSPVLNKADNILKINLHGKKNSLNVGICGAIAMNHFVENI